MTPVFERIVEQLAVDRGARVVWRNDRAAGLVLGAAAVLVFVADGEDLPELLPATVDASRAAEIDLILVGGGARARAALQRADLGRRMERFGVRCHVADDGSVWTEGGWLGRPALRRLLRAAARGDLPPRETASLTRASAALDALDRASRPSWHVRVRVAVARAFRRLIP